MSWSHRLEPPGRAQLLGWVLPQGPPLLHISHPRNTRCENCHACRVLGVTLLRFKGIQAAWGSREGGLFRANPPPPNPSFLPLCQASPALPLQWGKVSAHQVYHHLLRPATTLDTGVVSVYPGHRAHSLAGGWT